VALFDDKEQRPVFYYSGDERVQLYYTGFAVAKLRRDVEPESVKLGFQTDVPSGPLARLAPSLAASRVLLFYTKPDREQQPAMQYVARHFRDKVEYVLPVVEARREAEPASAEGKGLLIMTPRISVRFTPGFEPDAVEAFVKQSGLDVVDKQEYVPDGFILKLPERTETTYSNLLSAANALYERGRREKRLVYCHPDFIPVRRPECLADPDYTQWHLQNTGHGGGKAGADISAPAAWKTVRGKPAVRIAILDDSVQVSHPALKSNFVKGRLYDGFAASVGHDPSPRTSQEIHGTACAGLAVADDAQQGIWGVAPKCSLIGVHMHTATSSQAANAFRFCDAEGAAVISCSWSDRSFLPDVASTLFDLAQAGRNGKGTIVVFAAGNHGGELGRYNPFALLSPVVCVGASNWRDDHAAYSNHGPNLCVLAPSCDSPVLAENLCDSPAGALKIVTADNTDDCPRPPGRNFAGLAPGAYTDNKRLGFGGTSAAAPQVAGLCGLILSVNADLTALQVRAILEHTADRIKGDKRHAAYDAVTGHDQYFGHGRINAQQAVEAARADPSTLWPQPIADLYVAPEADGTMRLSWTTPPDQPKGLLIVRSARPIAWSPVDGKAHKVGEKVAAGVEVINVDACSNFLDRRTGAAHYAVFTYSRVHKYSWGRAAAGRS
jgi:subtilisin family serine protease